MDTYLDKNSAKIIVKCRKEEYTVIVDSDEFDKIKDLDFVVVKQHGFATINIYLDKKTKKRKSLGKIILNTEKNVYLKDRYRNEDKFTLNYQKKNLTTSIKEMEGYTELARENYYKNEEQIMSNRPEKRAYNIDIAKKFMIGKTGEENYSSKLTKDDVEEIRRKYSLGIKNQEQLSREYNVSRSTISSIVTYKRWNDMLSENKRKYSEEVINTLYEKNRTKRDYLSLEELNFNTTYHLKNENLFYYIEEVNENGLVYLEVRDNKKDVIVRGDLLFSDNINNQTKREYSIASKYPVKTPVSVLVSYVDKLKEYI